MSRYKSARDALSQALLEVEIDGPEWIKTRAAIAALDDAERAEATQAFIQASRRLDDAVAKLRAIVAGLRPNAASAFLQRIESALDLLAPLVRDVQAILSGEPASALPGMAEVANRPEFPTAHEPIVPPVRELARAGLAMPAADGGSAEVQRMVDDILRREGGFVDHPNDRGGPTKFGITLRTLRKWRGDAGLVAADVEHLGIAEAREIYLANYFLRPRIAELPPRLQPLMFDMSINHGPGTAVRLLQHTLDDAGFPCSVDGGIGSETLDCAEAADRKLGDLLVNQLVNRRVALYETIVAGDPSQKVFLRGWMNRANEFRLA